MSQLPSLPHYPIRNAARAVIVKDGAVLLTKFEDEFGLHYNWPGGGQQFGETIQENLHREVWEETRAEVEIISIFCLFEFLPSVESAQTGIPQTASIIFLCALKAGSQPRLPENPDAYQVDVEWLPIDELQNHWVLPYITAEVQAWYRGEKIDLPFVISRDGA
jgi:8-oxo-dGTP pyrophosphatase MutT (NUDIX family)